MDYLRRQRPRGGRRRRRRKSRRTVRDRKRETVRERRNRDKEQLGLGARSQGCRVDRDGSSTAWRKLMLAEMTESATDQGTWRNLAKPHLKFNLHLITFPPPTTLLQRDSHVSACIKLPCQTSHCYTLAALRSPLPKGLSPASRCWGDRY